MPEGLGLINLSYPFSNTKNSLKADITRETQ